jgi:hypothetical protein
MALFKFFRPAPRTVTRWFALILGMTIALSASAIYAAPAAAADGQNPPSLREQPKTAVQKVQFQSSPATPPNPQLLALRGGELPGGYGQFCDGGSRSSRARQLSALIPSALSAATSIP